MVNNMGGGTALCLPLGFYILHRHNLNWCLIVMNLLHRLPSRLLLLNNNWLLRLLNNNWLLRLLNNNWLLWLLLKQNILCLQMRLLHDNLLCLQNLLWLLYDKCLRLLRLNLCLQNLLWLLHDKFLRLLNLRLNKLRLLIIDHSILTINCRDSIILLIWYYLYIPFSAVI